MVRLKLPLMSLDASGSIGKAIVFAKWKGISYARRHAIPANPQSGLQMGVRAVFGFLSREWDALTAGDQAEWEALASAAGYTPLNAQIADGVARARMNMGWRTNLTDVDPASIGAPGTCVATAQTRSLVLSWVQPGANLADYCWAIYSSTVTGFTPDVSNLVRVVPVAELAWTHIGLTTGVPQYYRMRGLNTSGFLGTLAAQFTGTPL